MKNLNFTHDLWPENPFLHKRLKRRFWRKFFSTIGPKYTLKTVDGITSVVDLRDRQGVSKQLLKHGRYEEHARQLSSRWIQPESNIVDIGANIGFWSIHCARLLNKGDVYAFEPDPNNLELMKANLKLNNITNVKLYEKACGVKESKIKLYLSDENYGDHQVYPSDNARKSIEVDICKLDDELPALENISFVKIDIQGYEEYALKGMEQLLTKNKDVVVLSEFWPEGMTRANTNPSNYLKWMQSLGFTYKVIPHDLQTFIYVKNEQELFDHCSNGRYADIIFCRDKSRLD